MDIIYPLVSDLFYILLCAFFADSFIKDDRHSVTSGIAFLIIAVWFTLTVTVTSFLSETVLIKIISLMIISAVFISLLHRQFSLRTIGSVGMYHALGFFTEFIAWITVSSLNPGIELNTLSSEMTVVIAGLMSYLVQFLCTMFIRRYICRKETDIISGSEWLRVIIFPVSTLFIMMAIVYGTYKHISHEIFIIMYGVAAAVLFLNIYAFHTMIYATAKERQIREANVRLANASDQIRLYARIGDELKARSRLTHEYKNNLNLIKACVRSSEYDKLSTIVNSFTSELDELTEIIHTHNTAADIILNSRYSEGRRKGIIFIFTLDDLSDVPLSEPEITTLLANLTDNAVEACARCSCEQKVIRIGFINNDHEFMVSVSNTYDGIVHIAGGRLSTAKDDPYTHGCGMDNIEYIVNRHGGTDSVSYDDSEFCHTVSIPRQNN